MTQIFGPYSPIRQAGEWYFVSGQVGVDPETKQANPSIEAQTKQALDNLSTVLSSEGLGMRDVVKTTIYVTNMGDFARVNEIYMQHFEEPRPARATVGVQELPRVGGEVPIQVEIEAIAMRSSQ